MTEITAKLSTALAVALLTAVPLHAQDVEVPRTRTFPGVESPAFPYAQPEEVGLSSAKLNRLADEVAHWVAGGELVGAELLIVKDRRIVLHEAFGWADREEGRPMERNSLFSIKSMSKPFTATAILMLEEDGKLSLTDPVRRYVPTFTNDSTTIHHLLTHTSGYEDLGGTGPVGLGGFASLTEWVEGATAAPTRPFGEFLYSDFNFATLGYVVEAVSGVPVETFIEEEILRPLGLDETYTAFSRDAPWADRMNSRYRWDDATRTYERYWSNEDNQTWQFYPAAWGLYSTAMDYAEFLAMWMDKGRYDGTRLLTEESVEEALRPQARRPFESYGYGYGWFVYETPREEEMPSAFGHGGVDGTRARAFPAVDAMVIFLTHSRGRGHHGALLNRLGMLEILDHPGPYSGGVWAGDQDVAEVDLSPMEQAQYVGAYSYRGGEDVPERVVRVWQEGDRLHYRFGEPGERADRWYHLVPLGDHRFTWGRYRGDHLETINPVGRVQFVMEDGRVTGLEVLVADQVRWSADFLGVGDVAAEALERIIESRSFVAEGARLALAGEISEAVQAYQHAQERDARLNITATDWDGLCWWGSLWGHAAEVMAACEQAVALAPDHGGIRDSRGLARALTGDVAGAIADFEAFVARVGNTGLRAQRQDWIVALQSGKNPFTAEVLERLRN